jgi:hypothetical protein
MLTLDASRRNQPVPLLARWCLGAGIVATVGANLAHGLGHGQIGALVSAWPALALAGSFEMLMTLVSTGKAVAAEPASAALEHQSTRAIGAMYQRHCRRHRIWSRRSGTGTERVTVSVPSLASSTSTGGRSGAP